MHALVLLCINQQTKFEMPIFTISKDMTEAKCDRDHAPFRGVLVLLS